MSACIYVIKGLSQNDSNVAIEEWIDPPRNEYSDATSEESKSNVKSMNLRSLLVSVEYQEEILKATWKIVLSWLDANCSGLTEDEALRLRAAVMKVKNDTSWFDKDNPGKIFLI